MSLLAKPLKLQSTGADTSGVQFRVGYDAANYADFKVSSGGDITIDPTGGDITLDGGVTITGALSLSTALAYSELDLTASIVDADISGTAEIAVSKLADGAARQVLQTDAAGTGVEWTDNLDLPGTLDVTGAATLDTSLTIAGSTTVTGIIDDDTMATASATTLSTSESIKAYVDTQLTAEDLDIAGDSGTGSVDLDSQSLTIAGTTNEITTSASGQTVTIGLPSNITVDVTGNADTATKLSTTRTFELTGDVTGSVSSDLTSGASISTSIATGSIVDADINAAAAISLSKLETAALPTGITVASANIVDGTIVDADISGTAEIAVSKLADGAARQVLQTDAAGTGVEWTDNLDLPGTLDVTGAVNLDSTLGVTGLITASGGVSGSLTGNADTATKLSSSRTFELTGDITGSVSSDLTSGASISTSIASGSIVDADINGSAAISLSKLATGALPTSITIASANITDGTIVDADVSASAEIAVSKLADGTARQLLQTDAAGTGVEWTSNVDVPGTLDVTGVATFDDDVSLNGVTYTFPAADGSSGQVLSTDGAGSLAWSTVTGGGAGMGDGTAAAPGFAFSSDTDTGFYRPAANTLGIATGGVSALTIDGSQAVDLAGALTVAGDVSIADKIIHTGDTNTAIRFPAADTISFETSAAEAARVDSSGNLLIGTTTTTNNLRLNQKLAVTVAGSDTYTGASFTGYTGVSQSVSPILDFNRSRGTSDGSMTAVSSGDTLGYLTFRGADGSLFRNAATIQGEVDGAVSSAVVPGRLAFYTSSSGGTLTERMRIDSSGNVGIGVSSPGNRLEVGGTGGPYGIEVSTTSAGEATFFSANQNSGATEVRLQANPGFGFTGTLTNHDFGFLTNNLERMRITSGGEVGIGTSSPSSSFALDVQSATDYKGIRVYNSGHSYLVLESSSSGKQCLVGYESASHQYSVGLDTDDSWIIYDNTNSAERMRITSDGYLRMASGSGGIQFNGDTAAANALDDYEEGPFTPRIEGTASAGTGTYSVQAGRYVKIGRLVHIQMTLGWSAHTGTGNMRIAGLPFVGATVSSAFAGQSTMHVGYNNGLAHNSGTVLSCYTPNATSTAQFVDISSSGAVSNVPMDTSVNEIILSGSYYTA